MPDGSAAAGDGGEFFILLLAVGHVADERMAAVPAVAADLLRAPGVTLRLNVRGVGEASDRALPRVRGAATPLGLPRTSVRVPFGPGLCLS